MREENEVNLEFAEGILTLAGELEPYQKIVSIFLDGCSIEHLIQYVWEKLEIPFEDQLKNCVYISSKTGEFDIEKFDKIIKDASLNNAPVRAVDVRTKTGKLGQIMHSRLEDLGIGDIDFEYVVLYDGVGKSDSCVYDKGLPDEERDAYFRWLSKEDYKSIFPRKVGDSWDYSNFKIDKIIESKVTKKIKNKIDQIID